MQADSIVLGAGIVGVSIAVHLAQRGQAVVLVDRRGAGEETSFGNAGLIQREGVMPYTFPQTLGKLLHYGKNNNVDMHYKPSTLPALVPFLTRYWWNSRPERYQHIVQAYAPLIAQSIAEHAPLIEAAGAGNLIEKNGWYRIFRTQEKLESAFKDADFAASEFGVHHEKLDPAGMAAAEPDLAGSLVGAVHWTDPWAIKDPNALITAYLALFEKLGGTFVEGDATTLAASAGGKGWRVASTGGTIDAKDAVIALGPWADTVTRPLGYRLPLAVKRGYHMHYRPQTGRALRNWILDVEPGYLLAPMNRGIRLTTGTEFAPRDSAKTPIQLKRAEPIARAMFPLGERLDAEPWMGARPVTPDMMPIIGAAPRHPNLWFAFGHAHHGITLGPATGRLIAEMITGEAPFIDPTAFSPRRFAS